MHAANDHLVKKSYDRQENLCLIFHLDFKNCAVFYTTQCFQILSFNVLRSVDRRGLLRDISSDCELDCDEISAVKVPD